MPHVICADVIPAKIDAFRVHAPPVCPTGRTARDEELRETDDGTLHLSGYASVTGVAYTVGWYDETIQPGAFKRTLSESPDVQLLINHTGMPLARTSSGTMTLVEDDRGLRVDADLDPEDPDVQSLARKMRRGDIDQMSFAFQVTTPGGGWNDDYSARTITALSIHRGDVSVVNQGANPATAATIRSQDALAALQRLGPETFVAALTEWRAHTSLAREQRAGNTLSAAATEVLTRVFELVASADGDVDATQPLLRKLMDAPPPVTRDAQADRAVTAMPDFLTRAQQELAVLTTRGAR